MWNNLSTLSQGLSSSLGAIDGQQQQQHDDDDDDKYKKKKKNKQHQKQQRETTVASSLGLLSPSPSLAVPSFGNIMSSSSSNSEKGHDGGTAAGWIAGFSSTLAATTAPAATLDPSRRPAALHRYDDIDDDKYGRRKIGPSQSSGMLMKEVASPLTVGATSSSPSSSSPWGGLLAGAASLSSAPYNGTVLENSGGGGWMSSITSNVNMSSVSALTTGWNLDSMIQEEEEVIKKDRDTDGENSAALRRPGLDAVRLRRGSSVVEKSGTELVAEASMTTSTLSLGAIDQTKATHRRTLENGNVAIASPSILKMKRTDENFQASSVVEMSDDGWNDGEGWNDDDNDVEDDDDNDNVDNNNNNDNNDDKKIDDGNSSILVKNEDKGLKKKSVVADALIVLENKKESYGEILTADNNGGKSFNKVVAGNDETENEGHEQTVVVCAHRSESIQNKNENGWEDDNHDDDDSILNDNGIGAEGIVNDSNLSFVFDTTTQVEESREGGENDVLSSLYTVQSKTPMTEEVDMVPMIPPATIMSVFLIDDSKEKEVIPITPSSTKPYFFGNMEEMELQSCNKDMVATHCQTLEKDTRKEEAPSMVPMEEKDVKEDAMDVDTSSIVFMEEEDVIVKSKEEEEIVRMEMQHLPCSPNLLSTSVDNSLLADNQNVVGDDELIVDCNTQQQQQQEENCKDNVDDGVSIAAEEMNEYDSNKAVFESDMMMLDRIKMRESPQEEEGKKEEERKEEGKGEVEYEEVEERREEEEVEEELGGEEVKVEEEQKKKEVKEEEEEKIKDGEIMSIKVPPSPLVSSFDVNGFHSHPSPCAEDIDMELSRQKSLIEMDLHEKIQILQRDNQNLQMERAAEVESSCQKIKEVKAAHKMEIETRDQSLREQAEKIIASHKKQNKAEVEERIKTLEEMWAVKVNDVRELQQRENQNVKVLMQKLERHKKKEIEMAEQMKTGEEQTQSLMDLVKELEEKNRLLKEHNRNIVLKQSKGKELSDRNISALVLQNDSLKVELQTSQAEIITVQTNLGSLKTRAMEIATELRARREECRDLQQQVARTQAECELLKGANMDLHLAKEQVELERNKALSSKKSMKEELQAVMVRSTVDERKDRLSLESYKKKAQAALASANARVGKANQARQAAEQAAHQTQLEILKLKSSADDSISQCQQMKVCTEEMSQRLSSMAEKVSSLAEENVKLQSKLTEKVQIDKQLEAAKDEIDTFKRTFDKLKKDLSDQNFKIVHMRQELSSKDVIINQHIQREEDLMVEMNSSNLVEPSSGDLRSVEALQKELMEADATILSLKNSLRETELHQKSISTINNMQQVIMRDMDEASVVESEPNGTAQQPSLYVMMEKQRELEAGRDEISRLASLLSEKESDRQEALEYANELKHTLEKIESRARRQEKMGQHDTTEPTKTVEKNNVADINVEYLKNVVLNYLNTTEPEERKTLIPAIAAVLCFTSEEVLQVNASLNSQLSSGGGLSGYLFDAISSPLR
mmetsp:Transcript_34284/g.79237  ORF Transcript_34284/g.79237 Transcript_34284/m.79237 type:complete len:1494 (-) Transcript_34284:209-4690(-)